MLRHDPPPPRRPTALRLHAAEAGARTPTKVRDIAERQARRIVALAPDGLVLYDLQDEPGRTEVARPFPFLSTLEPLDYSRNYLAALDIRRVLYKCVGNQTAAEFLAWVDALASGAGRDACVIVGAPTRARSQGRFFISKTVFDASATKSLLSDHALRFARERLATGAVHPELLSVRVAQDEGVYEVARHLVPMMARERPADCARHLAQVHRSRAADFEDVRVFANDKGIPPASTSRVCRSGRTR